MPPSPQTTKLQSTLRLLIPRLRLMQKKDTASSVSQRRELAQLLDNGREASARIRVENVIATDIAVEVMEMVELYCELLLARASVLDQIAFGEKGARGRNKAKDTVKGIEAATESPGSGGGGSRLGLGFSRLGRSSTPEKTKADPKPADAEDDDADDDYIDPGLDEAAAAIFYSWPRFPREVRELTTLRSLLMDRWGKDFATLAQDNKATIKVPERLVKRLRVKPPSTELVESYLREIAKAYGIGWPAVVAEGDIPEPMDHGVGTDDQPPPPDYPDEDDNGGDVAAAPVTPQRKPVNLADMRRASEAEELSRATPPRDIGPHDVTGKSPVSVAPPKPSTDNPNPRVRIPGEQGSSTSDEAAASAAKSPSATRPVAPQRKDSKGIPDVDELSKRFAALKR